MTQPASLWLVGAGAMAGAMLSRWIDTGYDPARVTVIRPSGQPFGDVRTLTAPPADEPAPDVLMLGVKPQMLDAVAPIYAGITPRVLVSILAGVEEAALARRFTAGAIVRAMPNLPVGIGQGVVALASGSADTRARDDVTAMMAPLGLVEWIADPARFDAVTALAGSGPAFVYRFIDALAAAGTALGLPADKADRLALATVAGAGAMAAQADLPPATLADRVASRGGSTREGLDILDREDALVRLVQETLAAAARRNAELAAAARG